MILESSYYIYKHFYNWFLIKVALPFACLVAIFIFYLMFDVGLFSSCVAAFAHGEALVFAAVLLMELSFEGDEILVQPSSRFDAWVDRASPVLKVAAFGLIGFFSFIRYDVMRITALAAHNTNNDIFEYKLVAYSILNITVGLTSVIIAGYACFAYCEHEMAHRIEVLSGE